MIVGFQKNSEYFLSTIIDLKCHVDACNSSSGGKAPAILQDVIQLPVPS